MSGGGAPGGLPLIFRFSRVFPVSLLAKGGTLILVTHTEFGWALRYLPVKRSFYLLKCEVIAMLEA
jgi:hypothetical protein